MLMRSRFQFLLIKFLSAPYSADSMDDLVKSERLYYEKFIDGSGSFNGGYYPFEGDRIGGTVA